MKHKKIAFFLLPLLLGIIAMSLLQGNQTSEIEEHRTDLYTMNTLISMTMWGVNSQDAIAQGQDLLYRLNHRFSVTKEDSEVSYLNENTGNWLPISTALEEVLYFSRQFAIDTNFSFDPTVSPIVKAWGFTETSNQVPSFEEIQALLPLVDASLIEIDHMSHEIYLPEGMKVDLGAVAKGYAVDELILIMDANNVVSASIDLGGNVYVRGTKMDGTLWNVGIQNPYGAGYVGAMQLQDKAIITSGGYQRYFTEAGNTYHHIIDPRTGYPADSNLASVSIVSDSGMRGDALSTALFVMGKEEAIEYWRRYQNFDMILICEKGNVHITPELEGNFSLVKGYSQGELQVIS